MLHVPETRHEASEQKLGKTRKPLTGDRIKPGKDDTGRTPSREKCVRPITEIRPIGPHILLTSQTAHLQDPYFFSRNFCQANALISCLHAGNFSIERWGSPIHHLPTGHPHPFAMRSTSAMKQQLWQRDTVPHPRSTKLQFNPSSTQR